MKLFRLTFLLLLASSALAQISNQQVLSQMAAPFNRTAAEISAGVTPSNYGYPLGDVRRYGADWTGVANSTSAFTACGSVGAAPVCTVAAGTYLLSTSPTPTGSVIWYEKGAVSFTGSGTLSGTVVSQSAQVKLGGLAQQLGSGGTVPASAITPIASNTVLCNSSGSNASPTACSSLPPSQTLLPLATNTYNLGSSSFVWEELYTAQVAVGTGTPIYNAGTGNVGYYAQTAAEISASVTPSNYEYPPYNLLRYGADPTGTADSTTAIKNAHKMGYVVTYPAGTYKIATSGAISIPCGGIQGQGQGVTTINYTPASTNNIFTFTCSNGGTFQDFSFQALNVTSGYSFTITASSGENTYTQFRNVVMTGSLAGSSGISFIAASHWTMNTVKMINYSADFVTVNNTNNADSGDSSITNCLFWDPTGPSTTAVGVHQLESGGLKITANKFLGQNIGYELDLGSTSTSVLTITGNSFEQLNTEGILLQRTSGSAQFYNASIIGNEFLLPSGLGVVSNNTSSFLFNLTIVGNTFEVSGGNNSAVYVGNISNVAVSDNVFNSTSAGSTGAINFPNANTGVSVGHNLFSNFTTPYSGNAGYKETPATFTATLTGMSGTTTGTISYTINGSTACVWAASAITGTSNATTMTLTGMPQVIQTSNATPIVLVEDSSSNYLAMALLQGSTWTFNRLQSGGTVLSTGFTNSGTKGIPGGTSFCYPID